MPRERAFFQTLALANGEKARRCLRCTFVNHPNAKICRSCFRMLVKRPKAKRQRTVEGELMKAEGRLDFYLDAISRAVNRIRYYRKRIAALEKRATQHRQSPHAARAIRLRES